MKPACVQGLVALSALGIVIGDGGLLSAALEELQPWDQDENFRLDVTHLRACQSLLEGDISAAKKVYCKAIHLWPTDWPLWPRLARHFLQYSSDVQMATRCSVAASKLCMPPNETIIKLLSLCYSILEWDKGFKMIEFLLHNYVGERKYCKFVS